MAFQIYTKSKLDQLIGTPTSAGRALLNAASVEAQQALDQQHRGARRDFKCGGNIRRRRDRLAGKRFADRLRRATIIRYQAQKAVERTRIVMGGDKRPLPLAPHQHVFRRHLINGLAHRSLADIEPLRQLAFARNGVTRPPFAGLQATDQKILDLPVKRAKGRSRRASRVA